MDEKEIKVSLTVDLRALRILYEAVCRAYDTWPGGDAQEQVNLEKMKKDMYRCLYDTLLENDLV